MADRLAGKASHISWNAATFCIKKYSIKTSRSLVDTTDTCDYDSASDMLWATQLATKIELELSVEGNFRKASTPGLVVAQLYSGAAAVPVVLGLDAGTLLGHGNFDISDFETSVPVDDIVTFTMTAKLNGIFTPNA